MKIYRKSPTVWICLGCLGCALCAGCDRLAALPEWDDWAASEAPLDGTGQSAEASVIGAAVRDFSPATSSLALDDSAFRAIRHDDPRAVVSAFLDAVKRADNRLLQRLMSHGCLTACKSIGSELLIPHPSPLAECRVFHAEYLPDNPQAAHVRCLWSDSQSTRDFVFVLRNEADANAFKSANSGGVRTAGWRVAGLAVPRSIGTDVFDLESSGDLQSLVAH